MSLLRRITSPFDKRVSARANRRARSREVTGRGFLSLILLAAHPFSLAQGTWQSSSAGWVEKELHRALQSKQIASFDQGKVLKDQSFSNQEIGTDLAAAVVWSSRYPGVSTCLLLSKDSSGVHLLLPPEPDPDLPLTCTGRVAVAFVKTEPGFRVLAVFGYESPSRASIYYPLVLDVQKQRVAVDLASTERANKARDEGQKLRSIADLKRVLKADRGRE